MQSQIERLLKLNADCWQRNNLTKQHTECLLQEIVDLQLAIKEREQLIDKLKKQLALLEKSVEVDGVCCIFLCLTILFEKS
jgi:predicted RNase H-like nuclease (RuvC/YqgF family)